MASTRKRKRQADESFRKNFLELRDTGVPDTGPKRPAGRRTIPLTPAVVSPARPARGGSAAGSGRKRSEGRRESQKRGTGRRESGVRGSRGGKTPRTQIREDIRDLINSAVQLGDMTPAPARTVLTPHAPTPQPSSSSSSLATTTSDDGDTSDRHSQSTATSSVTEMEIVRRANEKSLAEETYLPSAPATPAVVGETPSHTRVLRSTLKGVHSLSSLRKKSVTSHTPYSVSFSKNIIVTEYSPEKSGNSTLDSSASSLDSFTFSPPPRASSAAAGSSGAGEGMVLEPLEEEEEEGMAEEGEVEREDSEGDREDGTEDEQADNALGQEQEEEVAEEKEEGMAEEEEVEREDSEGDREDGTEDEQADNALGQEQEEEEEEGEVADEEEEEESDSERVRMKTPHLPLKSLKVSSSQPTSSSSSTRKLQKAANKRGKRPNSSATKEPTKPPKTLSRTLIKNLFMLSGKRRMTVEAVDLIVKFSEVYLKQCSEDLATYTSHAGRKTMEVDDAILLMKRQRFIGGTDTFEYLVNTHLPLEYVEVLLPCAVAGKKIVPSRVK